MRNRVSILILNLIVAAGALFAVGPAFSKKQAKPEPCPDGRFLVSEAALVQGAITTQTDAVSVQGLQVSIDSGCPVATGKVRATKKGTIVTAKWPTCGTFNNVKLKAAIGADCG